MDNQNIATLCQDLRQAGFHGNLEKDIAVKVDERQPVFQLPYNTELFQERAEVLLHFRQSLQTGWYYLNRFDLYLPSAGNNGRRHSFRTGWKNGFSLEEGYHLLSGRAVYKDLVKREGKPYNAWLQLDFGNVDEGGRYAMRYFHTNYGYDLLSALKRYPIKELDNDLERENLLKALMAGERARATLSREGALSDVFVEANPRFKNVLVSHSHMPDAVQKQDAGKDMPVQGQAHGHSDEPTVKGHIAINAKNQESLQRHQVAERVWPKVQKRSKQQKRGKRMHL